jgi:MarR family transcriptional regulator, organic hydroperoxide resistance regulator
MPDPCPTDRASADPLSPDFTYRTYTFHLLSLASGRYSVAMERALKPLGLDQARWRVLVVLAEDGPRSIGFIAEAAVYKASTLSRIIGRMQAGGLVDVAPRASDNRVVEVSLTAKGRDLHDRSRAASSRIFHGAANRFNTEELATLTRLLGRLGEQFQP